MRKFAPNFEIIMADLLKTEQQFKDVMSECRTLFEKKLHDYGASWRILRPSSLTDQLYIKAKRIRSLMFVFEDLSKLDPGGIQTLLRAVEKDSLGLALKGASESLREMFFSNMSERAAKIMREDMESMGPVRLKDVDQAQMAMVQVAKDLAAKGEIMLAGAGGDDELIY